MTFPTIPTGGRVLFTNQADTSGTRTFPDLSSLTKNAGDLLIAIVTTYQSNTNPQFSSWGGGFTELSAGGDQGSATTMGIGIAYKISTGSETGTFTVTQAATITGHASMCLMSIPLTNSVIVPEAGTIANGTSAAADPGSFNPANWGTEDTLWISVTVNGMTSGTGSWTGTDATAPTNYSSRADSNTTDSSTVGQTEIAVAFRQLNAASEDVGAAGGDLSNARNSALIIAIPPVIAGVLAGVAAETFGAGSSVMVGAGALAGAASEVFGVGSSALKGDAPIAGAAAITITPVGAMQAGAPLAGSAAMVFGAGSSVTVGAGALAGVAAMQFGAGSSAMAGAGALAGVAASALGAGSSAATGAGALAGSAALAFAGTPSFAGAGALAGVAAGVFAASATADEPALPGEMAGVISVGISASAPLAANGDLSGFASLTFTEQGVLLADGALAGVSVMALLAQAEFDVPDGAMTGFAGMAFSVEATGTRMARGAGRSGGSSSGPTRTPNLQTGARSSASSSARSNVQTRTR